MVTMINILQRFFILRHTIFTITFRPFFPLLDLIFYDLDDILQPKIKNKIFLNVNIIDQTVQTIQTIQTNVDNKINNDNNHNDVINDNNENNNDVFNFSLDEPFSYDLDDIIGTNYRRRNGNNSRKNFSSSKFSFKQCKVTPSTNITSFDDPSSLESQVNDDDPEKFYKPELVEQISKELPIELSTELSTKVSTETTSIEMSSTTETKLSTEMLSEILTDVPTELSAEISSEIETEMSEIPTVMSPEVSTEIPDTEISTAEISTEIPFTEMLTEEIPIEISTAEEIQTEISAAEEIPTEISAAEEIPTEISAAEEILTEISTAEELPTDIFTAEELPTELSTAEEIPATEISTAGEIPIEISTAEEIPVTEMSAEVPTEIPTELSIAEVPTEIPTELSIAEVPTEIPTELSTAEVPIEIPTELSTAEVPTEIPTELSTAEVPTEIPTELSTAEVPSEISTEVPSEISTEIQSETSTEIPSETSTEIPSEVPTEIPAEAEIPTKVQTEIPTEILTAEVQTEIPTEILTAEVPTEIPTEISTVEIVAETNDKISQSTKTFIENEESMSASSKIDQTVAALITAPTITQEIVLSKDKRLERTAPISFNTSVPIDIFIEICYHLPPESLFSLMYTCKQFRFWLNSSVSYVTQDIWRTSRMNYLERIKLRPPAGMDELAYIRLTMLEQGCQFCGTKNETPKVYWAFRVRCCQECLGKRVTSSRTLPKWAKSPVDITTLVPYENIGDSDVKITVYWNSHLEQIRKECMSTSVKHRSAWIQKKQHWVSELLKEVVKRERIDELYCKRRSLEDEKIFRTLLDEFRQIKDERGQQKYIDKYVFQLPTYLEAQNTWKIPFMTNPWPNFINRLQIEYPVVMNKVLRLQQITETMLTLITSYVTLASDLKISSGQGYQIYLTDPVIDCLQWCPSFINPPYVNNDANIPWAEEYLIETLIPKLRKEARHLLKNPEIKRPGPFTSVRGCKNLIKNEIEDKDFFMCKLCWKSKRKLYNYEGICRHLTSGIHSIARIDDDRMIEVDREKVKKLLPVWFASFH